MIEIQAVKKRALLRVLNEQAKKASLTLREMLVAFQGSVATSNFKIGKIIISTGGSGQSVGFEAQVDGGWTQDNIFGLSEEFIQLADYCISQNTDTDFTDPANNDTLFNLMTYQPQLATIEQRGSDFTTLGWPNYQGGAL